MSHTRKLTHLLESQLKTRRDESSSKSKSSEKDKQRKKHEMKIEKDLTKELQLQMLRIQQGVFFGKGRVIIAFEGFDAAGKGGAIRRLTEALDPRGMTVHPIGPPTEIEQKTHWLYRFWTRLPAPGTIAIFDRTWYGRVLVERVNGLIDHQTWKRAYEEIREFERLLVDDGVDVIKIFLGISKEEQLKRFEDRLKDPYKQWKLTMADIDARRDWNDYVAAADEAIQETDVKACPWHLVAADNKYAARFEVLSLVVKRLKRHNDWMEARRKGQFSEKEIAKALRKLRTS